MFECKLARIPEELMDEIRHRDMVVKVTKPLTELTSFKQDLPVHPDKS
jgi:hypothetical protein